MSPCLWDSSGVLEVIPPKWPGAISAPYSLEASEAVYRPFGSVGFPPCADSGGRDRGDHVYMWGYVIWGVVGVLMFLNNGIGIGFILTGYLYLVCAVW